MKKQLKELQSQRQSLRLQLKHKARCSEFDKDWEDKHKLLSSLDGLFFRLCEKQGFKLSKAGLLL